MATEKAYVLPVMGGAKQQKSKQDLLSLLLDPPKRNEELVANLPLYLRGVILAKILYVNELYELIADKPGVIMEFGVWWGALLSLAGSIGGEWLGFELARRFGVSLSTRLVGDQDMADMRVVMARHGAVAVLVTRALPVVMETMSVVAGLSAMKRSTFLITSLAGTLPVALAYAYAGALSRQMNNLVPAAVILAGVTITAWVWYRARITSRDQ